MSKKEIPNWYRQDRLLCTFAGFNSNFSFVNCKIAWKKDHTTIIHGVNKISDEIVNNEELNIKIEAIKKKIMPS